MPRNRSRIGILFPALILFSIAAVVLRTISLLRYFKPGSSYYFTETFFNDIAVFIIVFSSLFFLIGSLLTEKRGDARCSFSTPGNFIVTAVLSTSLLFFSVFHLAREKSEYGGDYYDYNSRELITNTELILSILGIISIVYLVLALTNMAAPRLACGVLGLSLVLFFAVASLFLLFESGLPVNSPNKVTDEMAYLSCALFFLYDTRIFLSRQLPRCYMAFGLICAMITSYAAFPSLIYYIAAGNIASHSIYDTILLTAAFAFVIVRLNSYNKAKNDTEDEFIGVLCDVADKTEAEIHQKEETEKIEYVALMNRVAKVEDDRRQRAKLAALSDEASEEADVNPSDNSDAAEEADTASKPKTADEEPEEARVIIDSFNE